MSIELTDRSFSKEDLGLAHTKSPLQVAEALSVDIEKGLTSYDAGNRLHEFGKNKLAEPESETIWQKIKEQFEDLLVRLLLVAAVVSFIISCFGMQYHSKAI